MTLHDATEALLKTLDAAMVDNDFGHIVIPHDDVADVLAAMESATAALEGEVSQRARIIAMLREMHDNVKPMHNYYAYAANCIEAMEEPCS